MRSTRLSSRLSSQLRLQLRARIPAVVAFVLYCNVGAVCAQTAVSSAAPSTDWTTAGRMTFGAEALVWWLQDSPVPLPVVTDGTAGRPNTQVLLGDRALSTGANTGLRLSGAYALTNHSGLEGNLFYFSSRSAGASIASSGQIGSTNLIVPYIDATTGRESGTELSLAPVYSGAAAEQVTNKLLGAELNAMWALAPSESWKTDLIGGFRYLSLQETYTLSTQSPDLPAFGNSTWDTTDRFATTNNFYGLQAGVRGHYDQGPFFADGSVKVALGAMTQGVNISGSLVTNSFTDGGPAQTFPGGYFALRTNIGDYSHTAFAVVPEVALSLGYRITPTAAIVFGYSFLYASNVVRPGNQINRTVNTSQSVAYTQDTEAHLIGVPQPSFKFNDSGFWAQGINVGLVLRF